MNFILDVATNAQNPMSQTTTLFLAVGLILGVAMIGFGLYMTFKNKKETGSALDDAYDEEPYEPQEYTTNEYTSKDYESTENDELDTDMESQYIPPEAQEDLQESPFVQNEVSHSVKTSAYKVRDSIRCAHDIEDDVLNRYGYLAMLCDGLDGDEDTPAYISKRIMDDFYSPDRIENSTQDFFENAIDKLDAEIVKFSSNGKAGTSLLACVLLGKELYIIGVGGARLYHIRGNHIKQLTSEHRYSIELDAMVKEGEIDLLDAQSNPRRNELISYIGVGGINYIDMNDVPIMLNENDILLYCSDGLYNALDEDEIFSTINNYNGVFKNCAKVLTAAAMESANGLKDNDISVLMIKVGK
ncbi:MAG: hypothetical protein KAQ68_04880 [Clostridiales bacterium]|nr:hypothetical protein [Clostridiales bacterium]